MTEPATPHRAIAWRRPSRGLDERRSSVPFSWYGWGTVRAHRWQYVPPWGCTRWALPRIAFYRGGDEFCNDTLLVQVPLLGHVVFWKPWGPLRTRPCDECLARPASREMAAETDEDRAYRKAMRQRRRDRRDEW